MTQFDPAEVIARHCLAMRAHVLNRSLTRLYDDALRPLGLRVTQGSLLVAVARLGEARPVDLCRVLSMEKSTLSRDVNRLRARGWIEATAGQDARTHTLRITDAGRDLIAKALPAWENAQRKAAELLGPEAVAAILSVAGAIMSAERDS